MKAHISDVLIERARAEEAPAIADIHLSALAAAMPWLVRPYTDDETRAYFQNAVSAASDAWWVARIGAHVVGYMALHGRSLDHLYIGPAWQQRRIGTLLVERAKRLSPGGLHLFTFQRNAGARRFYEGLGFVACGLRDGSGNEEREPDMSYEWRPTR